MKGMCSKRSDRDSFSWIDHCGCFLLEMRLATIEARYDEKKNRTDRDAIHEEPIISSTIKCGAALVLLDPGIDQRGENIAERDTAKVESHDEGLQARGCLSV